MSRDRSPKTEVAKLRIDAKLQQKEFAGRIGVSVSYLQKVEAGKLQPSKRLTAEVDKLRK